MGTSPPILLPRPPLDEQEGQLQLKDLTWTGSYGMDLVMMIHGVQMDIWSKRWTQSMTMTAECHPGRMDLSQC